MTAISLLASLSPSTAFRLIGPSPPQLPTVPSLAELQKRAEAITSSLPSYTSLTATGTGGHGTAVDQGVKSATPTSKAIANSSAASGATVKGGAVAGAKPIPRVNISPPTPEVETPPGGVGGGGAIAGSWFTSYFRASDSAETDTRSIIPPVTRPPPRSTLGEDQQDATSTTACRAHAREKPSLAGGSPPPVYAPRNPLRRVGASGVLTHKQLRADMEVDQGRSKLKKMKRGWGRLQGGIPGEREGEWEREGEGKWEEVVVGTKGSEGVNEGGGKVKDSRKVVMKDQLRVDQIRRVDSRRQADGWLAWIRCGA